MTDTGHVPEGLPERPLAEAGHDPAVQPVGGPAETGGAGFRPDPFGLGPAAVSGQGAVSRPSFTFLDQPDQLDEEDDVLLMPGPQGSWSEAALREPASAEGSVQPGRPTGDGSPVDTIPLRTVTAEDAAAGTGGTPIPPSWPPLAPPDAAVQAAAEAAAVIQPAATEPAVRSEAATGPFTVPPPAAAAPRRPLHAGPPIPDPSMMTGQVPVRSLADRGPSGAGDTLASGVRVPPVPHTPTAPEQPADTEPVARAQAAQAAAPVTEQQAAPAAVASPVADAPVQQPAAATVPAQVPPPGSTPGRGPHTRATRSRETGHPAPPPSRISAFLDVPAAPGVSEVEPGPVPASVVPEVVVPEVVVPEVVVPEVVVPEVVVPEVVVPEVVVPEVAAAEVVVPEVVVPEVVVPEVVVPEVVVPEVVVPEVVVPEVAAAEAVVPEVVVPEVVVPEVAAAEAVVPEVAAAEAAVPEVAAAEVVVPEVVLSEVTAAEAVVPGVESDPVAAPVVPDAVGSDAVAAGSGAPADAIAQPPTAAAGAVPAETTAPIATAPAVPEAAASAIDHQPTAPGSAQQPPAAPGADAPAAAHAGSDEAVTAVQVAAAAASAPAPVAAEQQHPVQPVAELPVEPAADEDIHPVATVDQGAAVATEGMAPAAPGPEQPGGSEQEAVAAPTQQMEPSAASPGAPGGEPGADPGPRQPAHDPDAAVISAEAIEEHQETASVPEERPDLTAARAESPQHEEAAEQQPAVHVVSADGEVTVQEQDEEQLPAIDHPVEVGVELPSAERPADPEDPEEPGFQASQTLAAPGYGESMRDAVHQVMRERRDIRNGFRPDPIPHEVLIRVLEAAHTAPSVGYSQPWDFVVIRSGKTRKRMHELAERQRDAYAASLPKGRAKQFKEMKIEAILETPVNIVVTADRTRGGRHTLGRHTQPQMAPYSAALAVENLWLAARAEGLGVGWVSFFDEREMVRELGLPEHLDVVAYLCIGYVDSFPDEPELQQAGWAKKRPLSWVVHEEQYGNRALPGEEPRSVLSDTLRGIRPLDAKALGEAWERQKKMTKPAGSLGMLEIISAQLCGLSRKCPPPIPEPACVAVFAGDHGVHAQGVTQWPQEVTAQMVANFLAGGAVVNAFAAQVGAEVCVVDVGVASELPGAVQDGRTTGLLPRKIRPGTADMTTGPAMSREEALRALETGIETARDLVAAGNKVLITGDMGIANTTPAAAMIAVFTGADPAEVTGRGTGIDDETHARKVDVVRRALELHKPDPADPIGVLAAVGGLEHAAIAGLLLGAASLRTPVILDGLNAGAAALAAKAIAPEVLAACIAGHRSAEPGHKAALAKLGLRPLVDLDMRLGEGTGALLALPIVQSAARAMHDVATFDSAGVTEKR